MRSKNSCKAAPELNIAGVEGWEGKLTTHTMEVRSEAEEEVGVRLGRVLSPLVKELGRHLESNGTPLREIMWEVM